MNNFLIFLLATSFFTVTGAGLVPAATPPPSPTAPTNSLPLPRKATIPFVGTVQKVDKVASTLTLNGKNGGRVFHVESTTKITRAAQPATLADAKVGEEAAGAYREQNGKLMAVSLRLGPKPAKTK